MKARSLLPAVAALAAAALIVSGCSSPAASTTSSAGSGGSDNLVIYSNSVSDGRGDWLKTEAKKAGFTIQYVDLGGGDIKNRLVAEKNNPVADVTFGLNNVYFNQLKAAGVLDPYTPSWAGKVDTKLGDPDNQYYPIVREPIMLVWNKAAYPDASKAPADWPDLWTKSQFKGTYETPSDLGGATAQVVLSGILARYRDDKGEDGVSKAGWDAIKAFFADGSPAVKGTDLYARMKDGKVDSGEMWLAGKQTREKQYQMQTEAAHPTVGVPMTIQQVALVKGTKKAETAKKFIDWFGSAQLQAAWSKQFFTVPTNTDALPMSEQAAVTATDSFKSQDIDWSFVTAHLDQWVEKTTLDYLNG
jgi:iron(III) transport system substrate-binding protein